MYKWKNKPPLIYLDDEYYFVTVKTFYNKPIFANQKYSQIFKRILKFLESRGDFKISAGVLLPDHFHLLLMPLKKNVSEIMHDLKSYTSQKINESQRRGILVSSRGNGEARCLTYNKYVKLPPVWQKSFHYHIIGNDWDFENHYNYIIWNPEKHGYINDSKNWPWLWQK